MSGGFIFFFGFLALGYVLMALRAFLLAVVVPAGEQRSAMQALFRGRDEKSNTIETVVIVLIIPVAISWGSNIFDSLNDLGWAGVAFFGCLSMLFVLITLELSTLNSIQRPSLSSWKNLLIWACVWDLISIILLLRFIKPAAEAAAEGSSTSALLFSTTLSVYIVGIAALALMASFAVVLFAIGSQRSN